MKILFFVHHQYEEMELHYPYYRFLEAGINVSIAGPKKGEDYLGKHGYPCSADASIKEINEKEFDGLVIPGGYAPDKLRCDEKVKELTRYFFESKKLLAFICHAGWVPISAGIMKGIKCTSYHTIKDDLVNAGAEWFDKKVVVDNNVISSRSPDDLPVFCAEILKFLKK